MTALTQDRNTPHKEGQNIGVPVAAGAVIFGGSIVVVNAAGFATGGTTASNLTFIGRAEESINNTGGANGEKVIQVKRKAVFKFANLATDLVTQADFGKTCYIVDDQTVAKTNGTNTRSAAGKVLGVEVDGVWVEAA